MSIRTPPPSIPESRRSIRDLPTGELFPPAGEETLPAALVLSGPSRLRLVPAPLAARGHHLALGREPAQELLPLTERIVHLGRGTLATVRLDDFRVSRSHAVIVRHGDHVRLLDDRSTAGTFVNGRRITALTLHDGDVIALGPVQMRYVWRAGA